MPRRKYKKAQQGSLSDPKFNNELVAQLTNKILLRGKKSVAERIVYDAFDLVEQRAKQDPVEVFEAAVKNILPSVQVKSRRIGGATYQVPIEISHQRKYSYALRWLVSFSRARKGRSMASRLAEEIMEASQGKGGAVKKRQDTHRMAEANKAFSHYRM